MTARARRGSKKETKHCEACCQIYDSCGVKRLPRRPIRYFDLFEEDADTLHELVPIDGPIKTRSLRNSVAPILRRWIVEGDIHKLNKEVDDEFRVPDVVSEGFIRAANALGPVRFALVGGCIVEGYSVTFSHKTIMNDGISGGIAVNILKERTKESPVDLAKPTSFVESPRLYFEGQTFTRRNIVKHYANKRGGAHIDDSEFRGLDRVLERAAQTNRYGKPHSSLIPSYLDLEHTVVTDIPPSRDEARDCVEFEIIGTAQALARAQVGTTPINSNASDEWCSLVSKRDRFIATSFSTPGPN